MNIFGKYKTLSTEIVSVNTRIRSEISYEAIDALRDHNLIHIYETCSSVKNQNDILRSILEKHNLPKLKICSILTDYLLHIIPAGTKGVIRGNTFNSIIKEHIECIGYNPDYFDVCFETQCPVGNTDEKPDWFIREKCSGKIIIGMNQLDLWGGGQQLNRGSKYLKNTKNNTKTSKLLCVVCNDIQFKTKSKAFKLIQIGFRNNTLCYINNIEHIIDEFFGITE